MTAPLTETVILRCDCGWGEDVFEIAPAKFNARRDAPLRMVGNNPDRRIGDFASIAAAKAFLTDVMGYRILEEA
jgi:hypothetical protein